MNNHFYIVKALPIPSALRDSAANGGSLSATIGGSQYDILKFPGAQDMTGFDAVELSDSEFTIAASITAFSPGYRAVRPVKREDQRFCNDVELLFEGDVMGTANAIADAMVLKFQEVKHWLTYNNPKRAAEELALVSVDAIFTQPVKDRYTSIFEDYLAKYPR